MLPMKKPMPQVMMMRKAETPAGQDARLSSSRRGLIRAVPGLAVMLMLPMLAGCERFRHEKYTCPPNKLGLVEVVVNDDRAGAEASIIETGRDYTMAIGSITSDEMILANDEMVMIIDRNSGKMQVTAGIVTSYLRCEKSLFTM